MNNQSPDSDQTNIKSDNWCLVTVRTKKRDSFLKHLEIDIVKKKLTELILETVAPQESVYEDMVLIGVAELRHESIRNRDI